MAQHNGSRKCSAEFKRDAVELVRSSPDRTSSDGAEKLGLAPRRCRRW